jgi:hypothetical protein
MEVKQIYELMNTVTNEVLGKENIVAEDLSNVVDIGTEIINATAVDNYVRSLVDHIGRVVFVNRPYTGSVPSVLMDGWEYGSICEKISADMPEATENETWDLEDGTSYDPNIFYQPKVSVKFFNKRVTFEVPMSFTERQVKESFSSAEQLNGFISMIYNEIDKSMTVKIDSLVMRTIANMIGTTVYSDYQATSQSEKSGVKAINLLKLYKDKYTSAADLTPEQALTNSEFIRFASYMMGMYEKRLDKISTLFNVGGKARFTPADMLHVVLLADFAGSAGAYLQSDTFHNEFVALPRAEIVPYWQGSGKSYAFSDTSQINIKMADGNSIGVNGILGIMFDRDALGVCNKDRRVTTYYNAKGEFWNQWAKFDCEYFNDTNENFIVFFVA